MSTPHRFGTNVQQRTALRVRRGDTVSVDYFVWLDDGSLVDASTDAEPLVFTAGRHSVIEGLEDMVLGMTVGESKTERVPPERMFGPYRAELTYQVDKEWLTAQHIRPTIGLTLELQKAEEGVVHMVVTGCDNDRVTLDANHRLAGRHLVLQLEVLAIQRHERTDEFGGGQITLPHRDPRRV